MIGRRQKVWGVLLLLALLLAAVSCDRTSTNTKESETIVVGNDADVVKVELSAPRTIIRNYLGKRDTLKLSALATDANQVGVENATVDFSIVNGPGNIVRQDSTTDFSGVQKADYVVNLTSTTPQSVTFRVECNGQTTSKTFTIEARDVHLSSSANPETQKQPVGSSVTGDITLNVTDNGDIGIPGIPVRIEKISVERFDQDTDQWVENTSPLGGLVIQPVDVTDANGRALSTVTLNPLPDYGVRINIRTTISLPPETAEKAAAAKGGISLGEKIKDLIGKGDSQTAGMGNIPTIAASDTMSTTSIEFLPYTGVIQGLYLWVEQDTLVVPRNQNAQTTVIATAYDTANVAIQGLAINFELVPDADMAAGVISHVSVSDSSGEARATLTTNREYGDWTVIAYIGNKPDPENTSLYRTTSVVVLPSASVSYNLDMHLSRDVIFADYGITTSRVSIRLTDQDEIAVAKDTIYFATRYGYTPGSAITDSTGQVNVVFSDVGDTAIFNPATVTALYRKNGLTLAQRTAEITIDHVPAPSNLFMSIPTREFNVSATDSIRVSVVAATEEGNPVTPGTPIRFAVTGENIAGYFNPEIDSTDDNNRATSYYYWGTRAENNVQLTAFAEHDGDLYQSNIVPININPGGPAYIWGLFPEVVTMENNDPEPNLITCVVVDTFLNFVGENVGVQFTADKGTITGSATTNENGIAEAEFTAGTESGVAKIRASLNLLVADSIYINILPGSASSLALTSNVSEIMVAGTGGNENANITALVVDGSGNPVRNELVHFLLADAPRDSTGAGQRVQPKLGGFDGSNTTDPTAPGFTPYRHAIYGYGLAYATVLTNNGVAQISVTSGTAKGPIRIAAWVMHEDDGNGPDSSLASFSGLQVVAGPPDNIEVDVNMMGDDLGAAAWGLEVSARVQDARGNDVASGYAVVFGTNDPEVHIGEGMTGNTNVNGDSTDGVAYTTLTYHSQYTNNEVTIFASVVRTGDVAATDEFTFVLPIQDPSGILHTDLQNWNYTVRGTDIAVFDIECFVLDGHNHWINNQLVRFLTNKGRYYSGRNLAGDWVPAMENESEYTGFADRTALDTDGWADLWLVMTLPEAFPEPVAETTAQASAEIVGYRDATIEPIVLNLYQ